MCVGFVEGGISRIQYKISDMRRNFSSLIGRRGCRTVEALRACIATSESMSSDNELG
jgi:predicted RNA-binding protein YlqC (UPF0109 family)